MAASNNKAASTIKGWNKEVVDDQGRRRFHGAFTGGFSAGYFNTVGSAEGFTPSTFVSSRDKKGSTSEPKPQSIQDFMDDEDDPLLGKKLVSSASQQQQQPVAGIPPSLNFKTNSTVGMKLLQTMGWKEGHGIGPLIKIKSRNSRTGKTEVALVPPRDPVVTIPPVMKTDNYGLGYNPYSNAPEFKPKRKTGGGVTFGGFGLGALEDEEAEDTMAIYDRKSDLRQDFDFELTDETSSSAVAVTNSRKYLTGNNASLKEFVLERKGRTDVSKQQQDEAVIVNPRIPDDYIPKRPKLATLEELKELYAKHQHDSSFFAEEPKKQSKTSKEATTLQKGMMAAISSRFTSSKDEGVTPAVAVKKQQRKREPERQEFVWNPVPLLCKRFNVKAAASSRDDQPKQRVDRFQKDVEAHLPKDFLKEKESVAPVEDALPELPMIERPSVDLFKAIFDDASSSSSSSDDEESAFSTAATSSTAAVEPNNSARSLEPEMPNLSTTNNHNTPAATEKTTASRTSKRTIRSVSSEEEDRKFHSKRKKKKSSSEKKRHKKSKKKHRKESYR